MTEERKAYIREYMRTYRDKHREEINANARYRYQRNEEFRKARSEYSREYYEKNKDRIKKRVRNWQVANHEKRLAYLREYNKYGGVRENARS